jgi:hypothetical protein
VRLSIVIPALNEAAGIAATLERLRLLREGGNDRGAQHGRGDGW